MPKLQPIETHSYPYKPQIIYKEEGRTFHYTVLEDGFYPNKELLKFTRNPNSFPLPDNYKVMTTWGRGKNQNAVKCSINYENSKPVFRIYYGDRFERVLETTQSCTSAATRLQKVKLYFFLPISIMLHL